MAHRWPNPASVAYPHGGVVKYAPKLTTRAAGKATPMHDHNAFVDRGGDGNTDTVASHFHRVRAGRILPADTDGHTHHMTNLPAGAG